MSEAKKNSPPQAPGANPSPTQAPQGSAADLKGDVKDLEKLNKEDTRQARKVGRKVTLLFEHMYEGRIYGPGEITIDGGDDKATDRIADALEASDERLRGTVTNGAPVRGPNKIMTGVLAETEINGLTASDIGHLRQVALEKAQADLEAAEAHEKSEKVRTRPMTNPEKAAAS
jgi:hypothetical protein